MARKTSPGASLFLLAVIIAAFFVALYFLYSESFEGASLPATIFSKSPQQTKAEYLKAITEKYESKTIQYNDRYYEYKLRYPIGYDARMEPFPGIHQRFAAYYPPFSIELMDVRIVSRGELSEGDIIDSAEELETKLEQTKINGNTVYLMNLREDSLINENETVFVKQAFYDCTNSTGGTYWLSFTAGLSEALAPDLELVDYMINSVEC